MNLASRVFCLTVYLLALASFFAALPQALGLGARGLAALLLVIHIIEVPLCFRHIKRYEGPLMVSVILTLLFGFLHWKPIADAQAGA